MALVIATVTVDFTANYAGGHRVCWRIQGSGDPYDCTTIVNCIGGGTACQAIFTANVNTTSCDGIVIFEGYVQAICESVGSLNGQLPFTVNFTPNPICNKTELLCASGDIDTITITDGGSLYTLPDPVVITRDPADTQTLDAVISINTIGDGVLNSIGSMLSGGVGYVALDIINIDNGGLGTGGEIRVDSVDGFGTILTFTLTANGTDYVGPSATSFTYTTIGAGTNADFSFVEGVDFDSDGAILSFTISSGGSYDISPILTIPVSNDGTGLSVIANISNCPDIIGIGQDCNDVLFDVISLPHAETLAICLNAGGIIAAIPSDFTVTSGGCCIPEDTIETPICVDYHINNTTVSPIVITYTACDGINSTVTVLASTIVPVCAIIDGVLDPQVSGVVITTSLAVCGI